MLRFPASRFQYEIGAALAKRLGRKVDHIALSLAGAETDRDGSCCTQLASLLHVALVRCDRRNANYDAPDARASLTTTGVGGGSM